MASHKLRSVLRVAHKGRAVLTSVVPRQEKVSDITKHNHRLSINYFRSVAPVGPPEVGSAVVNAAYVSNPSTVAHAAGVEIVREL